MTTLAAVHPVVPPHRYRQADITEAFLRACRVPEASVRVMRRMHGNSMVGHRNLALPLERYEDLGGFTAANDLFLECAVELGAQAVEGALRRAGIRADEVDAILSTTVTGIAVPSLDARIAGRIGLRPDVVRIPLFGLGCVAGVAGIARMGDYLAAHPDQVAVLLSVELCSLTLQRDDPSTANLVASGLFGDGAAAVVALGSERAGRAGQLGGDGSGSDIEQGAGGGKGPRVLAARSHLYPDTLRTMGWDAGSDGLRIVLGAEVPDLVRRYLGGDVRGFLADHGLAPDAVRVWVTHPGGPKVIDAMQSELRLGPDALELTRRSLAAVGNLSSSSVLHVLADTVDLHPPAGDGIGVMIAMGPGFCSELVLLQW
ncbi:MAG TPA: type III polyketide synthase [Nakamurella sp.]|nr:type III polyketide synthase [Nakamurella sp.]